MPTHVSLLLLQQGAPAAFPWQPMVLVMVLAWFLLFRPVQKQRKEADEMRAGLKPGDRVLTTGGIYGTVTRAQDDRVQLRVADGVQIEFARSAIAGLTRTDQDKQKGKGE